MLEMAKRDVIPAVSDFISDLCQNVASKQAVNEHIPAETEKNLIMRLSTLNDAASAAVDKLEQDVARIDKSDIIPASQAMAHTVIPDMENLRRWVDEMETITSSDYWPYPSYFDLLYSVK